MSENIPNINEFFNKNLVYAVVGASNIRDKDGFLIFDKFLRNGFKVLPINTEDVPINMVQGVSCFPDLKTARPFPDVAVIVKEDFEKIMQALQNMRDNRIFKVWFYNDYIPNEAINFCEKEKFDYIIGEEYLNEIVQI